MSGPDKDFAYSGLICTDCGEECATVEETFSYSGTHCTHGASGVHHTGHYVSECCGTEVVDKSEWDGEDDD